MKIIEKILDMLPIYALIIVQVAIFLTLSRMETEIKQQNEILNKIQIDTNQKMLITLPNRAIDSARLYHYNQKKSYEIKNAK